MRFSFAAFTRRALAAAGLAAAAACLAAGTALAQASNVALFQDVAVDCLGTLPASVGNVRLDAPDEMPYVRSALIASWQEGGRDVFLDEIDGSPARVEYDVEEAVVTYRNSDDGGLERSVRLALRFTVLEGGGRVLVDDRCDASRTDVIPRSRVGEVENEAYPETQAELPQGGWFRRILEPAVVTTATAITVFLFFSLRSAGGEGS